jgi:hypothetical protein
MADYIDVPVDGRVDEQGAIKELKNGEALKSALFLYLQLKLGDILLLSDLGGTLHRQVFRTMTPDRLQRLHFEVQDDITKFFSPVIDLEDIVIDPNYQEKYLELSVYYKNSFQSDVTDVVTIYTKIIQEEKTFTWVIIPYEGQELYQWFQLNDEKQPGEKVVYNSEKGNFTWGKYDLINLKATDSFLASILALVNVK